MCECGMLFFSVVTACCLVLVTSFNIDTFNYALHKGKDDSMFGFSVATHKEQGRSWVLVGAPRAQGGSTTVRRGGVVYKCPTMSDNGCDEIVFNVERSEQERVPIDDKNDQWFGATVSSAGPDLPIVACAPRYVWFTKSREQRRDPVGTCYITKNNFRESSEYSPCRTSLFGYHRQGSCQAGFSAGISKDGRRLFVGAPGSWYWQGQMYSIDPMINFPFTPGIFGEAFGFNARPKGQVIQQSLDKRPAVMSTPEGPAKDDDSYMGYSMVVGDFKGEGVQGVAVGMPKGGDSLEGKVLLYTWSLTNYLNITGQQLGSYFGYALATSDVDGDKRDDIIIGAPLHTEKNNEKKYEVGRVYVFYQGYNGSFSKKVHLDGINSKSRFGLSLSTLGDLNLDGYGDFAVGAPYDGPGERGAVYIFQGSPDGVIKKYSQVIYAEDVQGSFGDFHPVSTFGFSLAGGLDLDDNDYPDVAIGAYLSDTAYFFRTRPVVKVEASVNFLTPNKQIYLDVKDCRKPNDTNVRVTCTSVVVCMRYTGVGTPPRVKMDLQYFLDTKKPKYGPRMYLDRGSGKPVNASLVLYKDDPLNCDLKDTVYLEEQIIDKLTDLVIEVRYSLAEEKYTHQSTRRDPRSHLLPIVDLSKPAVVNSSISIYKNCGSDNICIPDLQLTVENRVNKFKYEKGKFLEFLVSIKNVKEDAYNTKFYLVLPYGFGFKVARKSDYLENKIPCATFNKTVYICDIGNPFVENSVLNFVVEVEPLKELSILNATYEFYMNVTSANPEKMQTLEDNAVTEQVDIWIDAVLLIEGESVPSNVFYSLSEFPTQKIIWDTELGPSVIHSYTINNRGPSNIENVEVFIIWPSFTAGGEDLLYLLEQPYTQGRVKCDRVAANYKDYKVAKQKHVWDTLGLQHHYHYNATPQVGTENKTTVPGQSGDVITTMETIIMLYDKNNKIVHEELISGELNFEDYWKLISKFVATYSEPVSVQVKSTIFTKYANGTVVKHTSSRPGIPEVPYTSYNILSNSTSLVKYFDQSGKQVYEEIISEEPGSIDFKKRVKSTTDRYTFPLIIETNSTRQITYVTSGGKVLYQETIYKVGTGDTSKTETSKIATVINVLLYDGNGNLIKEETIESEPGTKAYWDKINEIVSKYPEPITVRTNKSKMIIYYSNGTEIRREIAPGSTVTFETPVRSHIDTATTVVCNDFDGNELEKKSILGDSQTPIYKELIDYILDKYSEPITVTTNTTKVITYRTSGGKVVYTGFIHEYKMEPFNQHDRAFTKINTTTVVLFYNRNGVLLHNETIADEPGTPGFWEKVTKITANFSEPVDIHTTIIKTITHYLNGEEIRKETISGGGHQTPFKTHTDFITTFTCYDFDGDELFKTSIPEDCSTPGSRKLMKNIINKYSQPIIITTNATKIITYGDDKGAVMYRGIITELQTKSYNEQGGETSRITFSTVVKLFGPYGNFLHEEIVTDEPGSSDYWEKINKIMNGYPPPITIRTTTNKTITYYVNGIEIRKEPIQGGTQEKSFTTHTDVTTSITCYDSKGEVLQQTTIPGLPETTAYKDIINAIIKKHPYPITIVTNTTKTIAYTDQNGNLIFTGFNYKQTTKSYNQDVDTSKRLVYVTVVKFYGPNGNVVHEETILDEPGTSEYWQKINNIITSYPQPISNIRTTTTKTIIYYSHGVEISREPVSMGVQEPSITNHVDIATTIVFRRPDGYVLYQTKIPGSPDTAEYNDIINKNVKKFNQPLTVVTNTTTTVTYRSATGKVIHTGVAYKEKIQHYNQTVQETKRETYVTILRIYGANGDLLHEETITEEPSSSTYWQKINRAYNTYPPPVNVHTTTTKTIIYYINGVESRQKTERPYETRIMTHTDVTTEVICRDSNGAIIYQAKIPGSTNTNTYKDLVQSITSRYDVPMTIIANTNKTTTYTNTEGFTLYTGFVNEQHTQNYNPKIKETTRTEYVTTVKFYGINGNFLEEKIIVGEPGTADYWRQINEIIGKYSTPVNIQVTTIETVVYYVDGVESRREPKPVPQETPYTTHIDINTSIDCTDTSGRTLYKTTIPGSPETPVYRDLINNLINTYQQPITIKTNTTKVISYRTSDGSLVYTGSVNQQRIDHFNNDKKETTKIVYMTIVKFYDSRGQEIHKETITHEPGTPQYWEEINKQIARFTIPITIRVTTTKTIVYYVNGVESRREAAPDPAAYRETPFTTQTDVTTTVTCNDRHNKEIYQTTLPGDKSEVAYKELISNIVNRYPPPITIISNTTKIIRYQNAERQLIYQGVVYEITTQHYNQNQRETSRVSTVTTVRFFDEQGKFLHEETIMDAPGSSVYWEKINRIIMRYTQVITIHVNTKKVITYYVDNKEVRSEQVPDAAGPMEKPFTSHVDVTSTVTCYGSRGNVLSQERIDGDRGSAAYNNHIIDITNRYREFLTIHVNTTKTITYRSADGTTLHRGYIFEQMTEQLNAMQPETTRTVTVTIITFYGPDGKVLHKQEIGDPPGSPAYWNYIKSFTTTIPSPVSIYTNTTKIITYYVNGREVRTEEIPDNSGTYNVPFTSHIEVTNVIVYYSPDRKVLRQDTVGGELTEADRRQRVADFEKIYSGPFSMETTTTKVITYRSTTGQVLFTDKVLLPGQEGTTGNHQTRTTTRTTFTIYDRNNEILDQHTIDGEPGSAAYKNYILEIMGRFKGDITIHTNSTKTITFYGPDGQSLNQQTVSEPKSTIQRGPSSKHTDVTTSITFYGPDGQELHHDTIQGAPGPELYEQLNHIAREYAGTVKQYNPDGSVAGSVTYVDTPYPGHKGEATRNHFNSFGNQHSNFTQHSSSYSYNQQPPLNYEQNYGKRNDYNFASERVDQSFDGNARRNFESYNSHRDVQTQHHNYLDSNNYDNRQDQRHQRRHKREVEDNTDIQIRMLSQCKTSNCEVIRCTTGWLESEHEAHIALRARVNIQAFKKISTTETINIQSMLLARISEFKAINGEPAQRELYRHEAITTVTAPQPDIKPDIVPLWVVIVSAVAGTLILLLLIFLLYKVGFFDRDRPSDAPERQPLNRNGHFQHGDEAL